MQFRGMEDRLNPIAPEGSDESTLGGYSAIHGRAAAFEGSDGQPYTAAIETERSEDGKHAAYLVFVRWAQNSTAIMGHVESGDLARAETAEEARNRVEEMSLADAKALLDRLIAERKTWTEDQG